jgi:hypothetical protein
MWSHGQSQGGLHTGFNGSGEGAYNPYATGYIDNQAFDTPDEQLYNPEIPEPPVEEWQYSWAEISALPGGDNEYAKKMGYDQLSQEEREAVFLDLQKKRQQKEMDAMMGTTSPPLKPATKDGSRWSPDDIPLSEKKSWGKGFSKGQVPPNQQAPKQGDDYAHIDADILVDPIIQMRNIIQGAIAYVQDWFDYVVQLIYDLLGTDFGWMMKRLDQTVLKSRIIQLIYMIIAIIDAFMNTDLKCGTNTNLNPAHMDYMIGTAMNRLSPFKFIKKPDGTFEVIPPGRTQSQKDPQELMQQAKAIMDEGKASKVTAEQKAAESGIIIKDCLKKVSADDLNKVRQWIRDFERRSGSYA